jgi:nicotinate-nucleotide pyrophosphorylase (carboxylating)
MNLDEFIRLSLEEDTGAGDHTSLSCIPEGATGRARLFIKDSGILAGMELAERIFRLADPSLRFTAMLADGDTVAPGMTAFEVSGSERLIVTTERLVLNCMQRMSGIATVTRAYVKRLDGLKTRVLDTRKTTPLMRDLEKWAVRIGGGVNHRMGLYDMILIKDNHVDYAGGITGALRNVKSYLSRTGVQVPVEIETRNLGEVREALAEGGFNRIMFDNFTLKLLREAVHLVNGSCETEASGGINLETARAYAETGVDFISVGALTHSVRSLDLSLKAVR